MQAPPPPPAPNTGRWRTLATWAAGCLTFVSRHWPYIKDLGVALRPLRFGLLAIIILLAVWLDSYTGQGPDVLVAYGRSATLGVKSLQFTLGLLLFSLILWLTMYLAVLLRFDTGPDDEPHLMKTYRTQYPAPNYTPNTAAAENEAERRVAWILWWRKVMPPALGAAAPFVTAVGLLEADGAEAFSEYAIWVALSLTVILAFGLWRMMPHDLSASMHASWANIEPAWVKWLPIAAAVVLALVLATFVVDPVRWGLWLGPFVVFLSIVAAIAVAGTVIAILSRRSSFPIFLLTILVLVVWHRIAPDERVRYLESSDASADVEQRLDPVTAFDQWLSEHGLTKNPSNAGISKPNLVPVIFVATAGGGSRAAYWTAAVLGKLQDDTGGAFSKHLIAISGVSGGSLGAAIFRTLLASKKPIGSYQEAGETAAAGDFLGPVLAAMATHDVFPPLSGRNRAYESENESVFHGDRAAAIEQAFERSWSKAVCARDTSGCPNLLAGSFMKLFYGQPLPALLLNGTAVETGARIITSSVKLECDKQPCTSSMRDVSDFLAHLRDDAPDKKAKLDIRVSSAVSNSARFPVVLPAATVNLALSIPTTGAPAPDQEPKRVPIEARIVDGGYFENFGATTLHELLQELQSQLSAHAELAPVVVQISSDPELDTEFDPGYGRPMVNKTSLGRLLAQLRVPLEAYYMTRDAHGTQARLLLQDDARQRQFRYLHFRICRQEHANPPLAWILSDQAQERLRTSLNSSSQECDNKAAFTTLIACITETDADRKQAACRPAEGS